MPEPPLDPLPTEIAEAVDDALGRGAFWDDAVVEDLCARFPDHVAAIRDRVHLARAESSRDADETVSSDDGVVDTMAERVDRRPDVRLRDPDESEADPSDADDSTTVGKYVLGRKLGHGGVGDVVRARDRDLNRDVALKFLRRDHDGKPGVVRRFVEEAQIGGQLQHPGIVPVYDLGTADGRPFFAMKLIRGRTLAELLSARKTIEAGRPRFLQIFLQVCQTVAFAHARGVIHRDLKPHNVMVGRFGEVQVVDWGLGKVLDRDDDSDEADASMVNLVGSELGRGDHSAAGSVFGTPAYMPPEQARGDVDHVGTASDVFGLGAILVHILTGKPPYVWNGDRREAQHELMAMAAGAKLDDTRLRLERAGVDPELGAICFDCLAPAASARPRDAAAVAQRFGDYLAAVDKRAEEARVSAAVATHRQRLLGAIVGIVGVALVVTGYLWYASNDARAEAVRQEGIARERAAEIESKNREIEAERNQARRQEEIASTALERFRLTRYDVELDAAIADARELVPAWPSTVGPLEAWLTERGRPLAAAIDEVRAARDELQARFESLDRAAASVRQFEDPAERFLHRTMQALADELESFSDPKNGLLGDVSRRLEWARTIEELSVARFRERWNDARIAILRADGVTANEAYASPVPLELTPQIGLVPIGMNPVTQLWEFYHLRSARDPRSAVEPRDLPVPDGDDYDLEGRLPVGADTGIVFVLIPGGTFSMGSPLSESGRDASETRHEVSLGPFFIARHELTQGQWLRLQGDNPSHYPPDTKFQGMETAVTLAHPVDRVDWSMCAAVARNHGLSIPTEAQWEYACRAGTTTAWSCGDVEELEIAANILDGRAQRYTPWTGDFAAWDDGFVIHAPVGSLEPNLFGLFDVHGNVWEWCRDRHGPYSVATRDGDGLRSVAADDSNSRVSRGGGFADGARHARSASRAALAPSTRLYNLGVRLARPIH